MSFSITIEKRGDGLQSGVAIRMAGETITRLLRRNDDHPTDFLIASPESLAEWIAENWWRLRWEPFPADTITDGWLLAHDLRAVGRDYAWPNAKIWGEGGRVSAFVQPDPVGIIGPVRFLTNAPDISVPASDFEHGVDTFIAQAKAAAANDSRLHSLVDDLNEERSNPEQASWRRLEARLGFDPDSIPEALMRAMAELADRYREPDIEETAAVAPGPDAGAVLRSEIEAAQGREGIECRFSAVRQLIPDGSYPGEDVPWRAAESLANELRGRLEIRGPINNQKLGEIVGAPPSVFSESPRLKLRYGLRLGSESGDRVLLRTNRPEGRRFELARALGDTFCTPPRGQEARASLGPIAKAWETSRQKFQRAFASSLLCPFDELQEFLRDNQADGADIENDDIVAAARYFEVSEITILTHLVNREAISRTDFEHRKSLTYYSQIPELQHLALAHGS